MKQGKEHNSEEDFGRHSVQDLNRRRARDSADRGGQAPVEIVHPQRNLPPTSKDYQYHCPRSRKMYNISMPRTRRAWRNGCATWQGLCQLLYSKEPCNPVRAIPNTYVLIVFGRPIPKHGSSRQFKPRVIHNELEY